MPASTPPSNPSRRASKAMNMASLASSCGACKFLRRKCAEGCVFAPYFSYDQGAVHFAAVHKVFGASNVSKLLSHLPVQHRSEAAVTISYEAQARMRDPVYGCVSHIFALQQQVASLQEEIETLSKQLAQTAGDDHIRRPPSSDGIWDCFQVCMQADELSDQHVANVSSLNSFNGENKVQGLPTVYRDAIERLECALFSDLTNDQGSLEDLSVDMLGEYIQ